MEAPAVGMPVFGHLTFGIDCPTSSVKIVDLPVKGASGHPAKTMIGAPAMAGHYCLQSLSGDDAVPDNNLGQENVNVGKLASPATFKFPLRNDSPATRQFRLEVDSYPPPVAPPCPDLPTNDPTRPRGAPLRSSDDRLARLAAHRRDAHPLPEGWSVQFSPGPELVLHGGEQVEIVAVVNVPEVLPTPRPLNVNAFADGVLAGGVTLYVHS
jgi:hypothetical protein